jgi:hypothetical protein
MVTAEAAWMAGNWGMAMPQLDVTPLADESREQARRRVAKQFERIGLQLMNRTRGSADFHADPIASILGDPVKRALAAQLLGQAFVTAYNFVRVNKDKVERVADVLVAERELFGDALVKLLDSQQFQKPDVDWTSSESWPTQIDWQVPEEEPWPRK